MKTLQQTTSKANKEIGKPLPRPNLLRPSDIIAIALPDGCWAYARILKDACMVILDLVSKNLEMVDRVKGKKAILHLKYYEPYDVSPWIYLGKWKFENEEESWGPPTYIRDVINPTQLRILKRGVMIRTCSEKDIEGLTEATLLPPKEIQQKIMEIREKKKNDQLRLHTAS